MNIYFHPDALREFEEAIDYYSEIDTKLGYSFAKEVQSALKRIISFPEAWTEIDKNIRRCLIHRFPFGVLYAKKGDAIYILAIMHLHRNPAYWKDRK